MILENWIQCNKGNVMFARLNVFADSKESKQDVEEWERLYNEYLQKYGLNDIYKQYLTLKIKIAKCQIDYILHSNRRTLNDIRIYENDLEKIKNISDSGTTIEEILMHLSKWFKNGILRTKDVTLGEYLILLKQYERAN